VMHPRDPVLIIAFDGGQVFVRYGFDETNVPSRPCITCTARAKENNPVRLGVWPEGVCIAKSEV
jgi:hypothetical protein